ncbi:FTR1 family iron permease [Deinococcus roseus]|uniref:Iron permease n=1 Tax=Deinococcus roseus TaxID=392414 RepID=A0ABQ2DCC1_9DEIO|nr:FTR1 family protein [Deinococcus roseus]GGJ53417.1 iron permease [Deinococcus roseus]
MKKTVKKLALTLILCSPSALAAPNVGQLSEDLRSHLINTQLEFSINPEHVKSAFQPAREAFAEFKTVLTPAEQLTLQKSFDRLTLSDARSFAVGKAEFWTAVLQMGMQKTLAAVKAGNVTEAQNWLAVREYRQVTRFSRPEANGTVALENLRGQHLSPAAATQQVKADLLDGYQARLNSTLEEIPEAISNDYPIRAAELVSSASGYFSLLSAAHSEQLGTQKTAEVRLAFKELQESLVAGSGVSAALKNTQTLLRGFRAAPLSEAELVRKTGQMLRFLKLVPIEYDRGVKNGTLVRDLEVQEALTFARGAVTAFNDLESSLIAHNSDLTQQTGMVLRQLESGIQITSAGGAVLGNSEVISQVDQLQKNFDALLPENWRKQDGQGDLDVISSILDQMEMAVQQGRYDLAESARLEAYATLEAGGEARLKFFAPQLAQHMEELFWQGQDGHSGLAALIAAQEGLDRIQKTRALLDRDFEQAIKVLGTKTSPVAIGSNAAVIVFREGLEAVLILAALLASLKKREVAHLRRPLWLGAAVAFVFSGVTWVLLQGVLSQFAKYGEKLEAVVSVLAIVVLLIIMNWFFHNVYWTGWMANFHQQKQKLVGRDMGQWVGLVVLGFTSIYREGFETVLFLQSLVLQAGNAVVLLGTLAGLLGVGVVGALVFLLQTKLPHKKMLSATGLLICLVLFTMLGNTTHVLQLVGWFPIHAIDLQVPTSLSLWLGIFPTWEGFILQLVGPLIIIGSYFGAEHLKKAELKKKLDRASA